MYRENATRWLRGVDGRRRGLGSLYGERLVALQNMRIEEIQSDVPLSESFIFDKTIDWEAFWAERERITG
jgi:hypothetical protein